MHDYLVPYVGRGVEGDVFRPDVEPGCPWSAIDLRPDATRRDGVAIVSVPSRMHHPHRIYLGDAPSRFSSSVRRLMGSRLGLTLRRGAVNDILPELLIQHARTDGSRWRPLWPHHAGRYEIWLGDLRWRQPMLAGGSVFTESFDQADSTTLGPTLTWTEVAGNLQTVSNQVRCVTANVSSYARADADVATVDHYVELNVVTLLDDSNASARSIGVCCRCISTAVSTFYHLRTIHLSAGTRVLQLYKFVTGSATQLGSNVAITLSLPSRLRVQASGSSIAGSGNGGATTVGPSTDTAITTNTRGGIRVFDALVVSDCEGDAFEVGDLAAPASTTLTQVGRGGWRGSWRGINRGAA